MRTAGSAFVMAAGLSFGFAFSSPLMARGGPENIAESGILARLVGDAHAAQFFRKCERFEQVVKELENIKTSPSTFGLPGGASEQMQRDAAARARQLRAEGCPPRTAAAGPGVATASASRTTVTVSGGGSRASVPQVQGGTQFDPVQNREVPITFSDGRLTGGSANVAIVVPSQNVLWGDYFYVSGGGSWFDGQATNHVPVGATGVAQTYIVPNPVSNSTGILAGATGQTTQIDSDGRVIDISVGLRSNGLPFFGGSAPSLQGPEQQINLHHSVGFRYRNLHLSHTIRQQSDVFPDLSSQIDLRQDSNFFGADFGLGVGVAPPASQSGIFAGIQGFVAPGLLSTSAEATQVSHCGPCGIASPEFVVSLQRDLSSSNFAVIAGGSAQLGYRFGPGIEFTLFGTVEHMTGIPFFNVPTTPNQQPINLDGRDSMTNVTVGARFTTAMFSDWHN